MRLHLIRPAGVLAFILATNSPFFMDQALRSKLDRVTNILFAGGVSNPVTYIEQISYLIYLKLLDERESELALERSTPEQN